MIRLTTPTGLEFIQAVSSTPEEFSAPAPSNPMETIHNMWSIVPSDLRDLPEQDRDLLEEVWRSMLHANSSILTELAFYEESRYLTETPSIRPQKWVKFPFITSFSDPESRSVLNSIKYGGNLTLAENLTSMTISGSQGKQAERLSWKLPASFSQELSWDLKLDLDISGSPDASVLIGVGSVTPQGTIKSGVFITRTGPSYLLCQIVDSAILSSTHIDVIAEQRDFNLKWDSVTQEITATVDEMSVTTTLDPSITGFNEFFITSIPLTPVTTFDITYQVVLYGGTFWAPILAKDVKYAPYLQPSLTTLTGLLFQETDFTIVNEELPFLKFITVDDTPEYLWAEYVGLRSYTIRDTFAAELGVNSSILKRENSETFKNLVFALRRGLLGGPHSPAVLSALAGLSGIPVALGNGTVVGTYDRQGIPAIVVKERNQTRVYYYADYVTPSVTVGDTVSLLDLLADPGELITWTQGGALEKYLTIADESEKYKSMVIQLPVEAIEYYGSVHDLDKLVRQYLEKIIPLWVGIANLLIAYIIKLESPLSLVDELTLPFVEEWFAEDFRRENPLIYAGGGGFHYGDPIFYAGLYWDDSMGYPETDQCHLTDDLIITST